MPAPWMWLNPALEDALHSYLSGQIDPASGATIYRMAEATALGAVLPEPRIGIVCPSGRATADDVYLGHNTSSRIVGVRIAVRTHAEDGSRRAHGLLVGMVLDALCRSDIVDVLNAQQVPGLAVNEVDNIEDKTQTDDKSYVTELSFDVLCHVRGDA